MVIDLGAIRVGLLVSNDLICQGPTVVLGYQLGTSHPCSASSLPFGLGLLDFDIDRGFLLVALALKPLFLQTLQLVGI